MSGFDLDNPNLDGDFKELKKLQKKWRESRTQKYQPPPRESLKPDQQPVEDADTDHALITKLSAELLGSTAAGPAAVSQQRKDLFTAVEKNDVSKVEQLIKAVQGLDLSLGNPSLVDPRTGATLLSHACMPALRKPDDKATILHHAIAVGSDDVARALIRSGDQELLTEHFAVTVADSIPSSKSCLHQLTEKGNLELAELLLDNIKNPPVRTEFMGRTVLTAVEGQRPRDLSAIHIACLKGDTAFVNMLLRRGIDVNSSNSKKDTPILWAARFNHLDTTRCLIAKKADCNVQNDKGSSPLYWAVRYGFPDMAKLLLEEGGADVNQERAMGLVTPLSLAATLGHTSIVSLLLKHGANVSKTITGGRTALHLAASQGHTEIVELLLEWKADLEAVDDMGNSAVLHATMEHQVDCMHALLNAGAEASVKNKKGQTVWDFVIGLEDTFLLESLVSMYKAAKRLVGRKIKFPPGKTPLMVCALKGDSKQLRLLLELGVDKGCLDQNHNTFYHLAARENKVDILEQFLDEVDLDQENNDGETALHLAARSGKIKALNILLKKAKLNVTNKLKETPLHVAASSPLASAEAVAIIVDVVVKAHNWSLVDSQDEAGNTPLHHAAHAGRAEIMDALSQLNPKLLNKHGDSPFHRAVSQPDSDDLLDAMLVTFNKPEKDLDINQPKADGETMLHIAAKNGAAQQVEMLIHVGADLSAKDADGNTVLHDLVLATVESPHNEQHVQVFQTIIQNVALWWCMREDLHVPDYGTAPYLHYQAKAVLYLTQSMTNHQRLSVTAFATHIGAAEILQAIFNIDHVYRFKDKGQYLYDVTSLTTETMKVRQTARSSRSKVGVLIPDDPNPEDEMPEDDESLATCLEIVVQMEDEVLATKMLDIHPLKELVANFWGTYQWIYALLMVLHIVYMSCLTVYAIPYTADSIHGNQTNTEIFPSILFMVWPVMIILFEIYYFGFLFCTCSCRQHGGGGGGEGPHAHKNSGNKKSLTSRLADLTYWLFDSSTVWGGMLFALCTITWFALYIEGVFEQVYLLAMALMVGWLFTIAFTKGFQRVHAFSIMLKYIIINDISRFLFLYSFMLLGFGFAMHTLFQISPNIAGKYPTGWHSLFTTFNMMIGMDEIFDEDTDAEYKDNNSNSIYIRIVFLFYIIMSTIIMLNLLIAMMSDTYNAIKSREGQTWRVASVRMALNVEKALPWVSRGLKAMKLIRSKIIFDPDTRRWILPVSKESVIGRDITEDAAMRTLYRLEGKVNHLSQQYTDLSKQLEDMAETAAENDMNEPSVLTKQKASVMPTSRPRLKKKTTLHTIKQ